MGDAYIEDSGSSVGQGDVYSIDSGSSVGRVACEVGQREYDRRFLTSVCESVANNLDINYADRGSFIRLLRSCLKEYILGRNGILEQYLHSQLDKLAKDVKGNLGVPEDIGVNYRHAIHAKFRDIIDYAVDVQKKKLEGIINTSNNKQSKKRSKQVKKISLESYNQA